MNAAELTLSFTPSVIEFRPKAHAWNDRLRETRQGVMLHYDGSSTDAGGISWLASPSIKASYNLVVPDDGSWATVAPLRARAWHAGRCRPSEGVIPYDDANSAFYGIAILNSGREDVTPRQMLTAAWLIRRIFERHGWHVTETERLTTHSAEAWPRGRKIDPEGPDPNNPILSRADILDLLPIVHGPPL